MRLSRKRCLIVPLTLVGASMDRLKTKEDLEQSIIQMLDTDTELSFFLTQFSEGVTDISAEEVFNIISGIKALHKLRFQALWDCYIDVFEEDIENG